MCEMAEGMLRNCIMFDLTVQHLSPLTSHL